MTGCLFANYYQFNSGYFSPNKFIKSLETMPGTTFQTERIFGIRLDESGFSAEVETVTWLCDSFPTTMPIPFTFPPIEILTGGCFVLRLGLIFAPIHVVKVVNTFLNNFRIW